jgi:5,10-methylenetetrahydromethanopterin reductase
MKVMLTLAPDDLALLRERVRACDEYGFTALGFGDSPAYHDPYVSMAIASEVSNKILLGPMVTNVVTRAPQVTGRALKSLNEMSCGRIFLGIGAGDSALVGARRSMASLQEMRAGINEIRTVLQQYGKGCKPAPVVLAANGPRTLELAGEVADIAVTGAGVNAESIERAWAAVRTGAERSGREVELWAVARVSIAANRNVALTELRPLLASGANHVFASRAELELMPTPVSLRLQELRKRYNYEFHGRQIDNPNADLVDQLGLRQVLGDRFAIAGTAMNICQELKSLAALGVSGVVIPAVGVDVDNLIRNLGREVLPFL